MTLLKSIIIRTLIIFIICLLAGFAIFREQVFEVNHPGFGFIFLPIIATVIFSLKLNNKKRDLVYSVILLIILDLLLTKTFNLQMIFTHVLFIFSVLVSIVLFTALFYKLEKTKFVRPFLLSSFFAIALPIANFILWAIYTPDYLNWHLFQNLPYGFVMGLSIGTGIELSELVISTNYWDKLWNA